MFAASSGPGGMMGGETPITATMAAGELRRRAVSVGVLVAVCEIVLARMTFDTLPWFDVVSTLLGVGLATVGLVELMRLAAADGARTRVYLAFGFHLPLALVLGRLVGNAVLVRNQALATALTLAIAVLVPTVAAMRARRGARVDPTNVFVVGAFAVATLIAALLRAGAQIVAIDGADIAAGSVASLPPLSIWAGLVGLWCAAGVLCSRLPLVAAAVALALAVASWPLANPAPRWVAEGDAPDAPDIVLLTVDTLRADAAATMSSFARLQEAGVVFSNAQAPSPWTLPSLATVMTGALPAEHGALRLDDGGIASIDATLPTLAERFSAAGYDTAAVLAPNVFVSPTFGLGRGFAHLDYALDRAAYAQPVSTGDSLARPLVPDLLMSAGLIGRRSFGGASSLADRAIAILEQRRARPLFLWVHFLDCHIPYRHATETDLPRSLRTALSGGDVVEMARGGELDAVERVGGLRQRNRARRCRGEPHPRPTRGAPGLGASSLSPRTTARSSSITGGSNMATPSTKSWCGCRSCSPASSVDARARSRASRSVSAI